MRSKGQDREKLIKFLDQRAFDPILKTSEQQYETEKQKSKLREVKARTKRDKRRYHEEHRTAEAVRNAFMVDIDSTETQQAARDLEHLDLPRLPDLREDFLKLCDDLDVNDERRLD